MGEIYRDDMIVITQEQDGFYLESLKPGKTLDSLNDLLKQMPDIKITQFMIIMKVLANAPYGPELFAVKKERISIEISDDSLQAYMTLCIPPEELNRENRSRLSMEIMDALRNANVNYGILFSVLNGDLPLNKPILIAKGTAPVNGRDSEVKLFRVPEPRPQIVDDGSVNYYNMNLIHQVQNGEWLGERIDPVPGIPGKNVHGEDLAPLEGVVLPLQYERESVEMVREDGKDVLYSLKAGAVHYVGDSIAVYDVMEINGNVDFNSGNIDFNGFVSIKGVVEETFSVRARRDIEISGEYGLGGVDTIESLEGNIYIRGGVAGKGRAKIICNKNLYVKYLSDAEVICGGSVYVGFYVRNSNIRAKQVIVDSPRGQIAGGIIDADIRVECADIGNWMETRTKIVIRGFDRGELQKRMEEIAAAIREKKTAYEAEKDAEQL